jgi:hypothetical protein
MLNVHQVREIVRANLSGNRLKSFAPLPSPDTGTYILHLRNHPFKVVLKIIGDEGMGRLDVERAVERVLAEVGRVQVPEFICLDDSRKLVPFRYYLRAHIPGLQWSDVMLLLPTTDGVSLARRCGEMLGAFHGIEAEAFGEIDGERISLPWSSIVLDRAMEHLGELIEKGWIDSEESRALGDRLLDSRSLLDLGCQPQLTHRRLNPSDILVKNDGGQWIVTGLLGVGRSAMWYHMWDMASLVRQIGEDYPELLGALEEAHYGIVSRPADYDERLEVYMIIERLDFLSRQ